MKKFKVEIYEIEEAFFNTLHEMTEGSEEVKAEAIKAFSDFAAAEDKYDFMAEYLAENDYYFSLITDDFRCFVGGDSGMFYIANDRNGFRDGFKEVANWI